MLGVWYPEYLFGPNASVPLWLICLVIAAFVVGFAAALWLLRNR